MEAGRIGSAPGSGRNSPFSPSSDSAVATMTIHEQPGSLIGFEETAHSTRNNTMLDARTSQTGSNAQGQGASAKLHAALDYLGDKLATHRASRFKPAKQYLLREWLSARRMPAQARSPRPQGNAAG